MFVKISLLVCVTTLAISFCSDLTLTPIVKYSVGYRFGFFISLEIISFSQTVKETSRAGNHPVWTSKNTSDLVTNFVAQMRLVTSLVFTRILNQANPQYWFVYLLNGISWENEPESYLLAISLGQFTRAICKDRAVGDYTNEHLAI